MLLVQQRRARGKGLLDALAGAVSACDSAAAFALASAVAPAAAAAIPAAAAAATTPAEEAAVPSALRRPASCILDLSMLLLLLKKRHVVPAAPAIAFLLHLLLTQLLELLLVLR